MKRLSTGDIFGLLYVHAMFMDKIACFLIYEITLELSQDHICYLNTNSKVVQIIRVVSSCAVKS